MLLLSLSAFSFWFHLLDDTQTKSSSAVTDCKCLTAFRHAEMFIYSFIASAMCRSNIPKRSKGNLSLVLRFVCNRIPEIGNCFRVGCFLGSQNFPSRELCRKILQREGIKWNHRKCCQNILSSCKKRDKQTAGDCSAVGHGDSRTSSPSFPQWPIQLKHASTKSCVLDQDIGHY